MKIKQLTKFAFFLQEYYDVSGDYDIIISDEKTDDDDCLILDGYKLIITSDCVTIHPL